MPPSDNALRQLRNCLGGLVKMPGIDFTLRQLTLFLTICQDDRLHTVRGLAQQTCIEKTNVTRALDRIEQAGLVVRQRDPADRRSVVLLTTPAGEDFYRTMTGFALGRAKRTVRRQRSNSAGGCPEVPAFATPR